MTLTPNAVVVLGRRYLKKNELGEIIETPDEMFTRVARAVVSACKVRRQGEAEAEDLFSRFEARMKALEFLPNSPALMNAGRALGQLSACFVVPVLDTTFDLFRAVGYAAEIQKSGGGTGFSFSRLRPAGDRVASTGGQASGPVAFMQIFDAATEAIKQGGTRRGANMGILRIDHPDILDFIALKLDKTRMTNFNLSVAVTDAFMLALSRREDYPLINPRTGQTVRTLGAARVFELLANAAWATGDPGLVFIDRINQANPTPALGDIEATNPCGEQPLLPFESCTLGSVNLGRFTLDADLDWPRLAGAIRDGVDFLDLVIDANRYPLPEIALATKKTRKIGLGVMGFADALIALGIPYDDERAFALAERVAAFVETESLLRSEELATRFGVFPAFEGSRHKRRLRNATTTTVAPTGTISIIAGCSSGIEPLYAVAYERHILDGEVLAEIHPAFLCIAKERGFASDAVLAEVRKAGSLCGIPGIPDDVKSLFKTAHDLPLEAHIRMQAAFQKHVHSAVSKTVNLKDSATPGDVERAYLMAYDLCCKGITVFRDRSKGTQVLAVGETPAPPPGANPCSECGAALASYERCRVCHVCGFSACL